MRKVKYVSLYHYCSGEYNVSFNRGEKAQETPKHKNITPASLKRVANIFYNLVCLQPTFMGNYVHLQAYTKGEG